MKNLYLAILLLAFAANLSAFDKVWELQFSSTPHHVHYTEGHKELIVGEGNTFKKYNAETGVLIDSVVYSLDALKDYTIGEFHVTDDLKSFYFVNKDSIGINLFKYDIVLNKIHKKITTVTYQYGMTKTGNLIQIVNNTLIFTILNTDGYSGPPNPNFKDGIIYVVTNDSCQEYYRFAIDHLNYNTFSKSFIVDGSNYYEPYRGKPTYNYYSRYANLVNTNLSKEIVKLNGVLSKNDKYIYSIQYTPGYIYKYDFSSLENKILKVTFETLLPFKSDDEMILGNKGKIYHYNFKVNSYLDSINLGNNNSFLTNLNNNYLLSINTNKIAAYKSGANPKKVISYLKDTIITKSVGDTITLNAISNLNPDKEEWDLGDSRTLTGDTIKFTYPKKGEYLVKYKGTYKDTVVNLTCKVNILDTLAISFTHKVEMKQGYTELTITSEFSGDYDKVIYNPNPGKGKTNLAYVVIDSSLNKVTYKISTSDIYYFTVSIGNSIKTISKRIELIIPVNDIKNTDYNLLELNYISNILPLREDIYFQQYDYTAQTISYDQSSGYGSYLISVTNYLYNINQNYGINKISQGNITVNIRLGRGGVENFVRYYAVNRLFASNNSLIYADDLAGNIVLLQDSINYFNKYSLDIFRLSSFSINEYKSDYVCTTSKGIYLLNRDFSGTQYKGKNLDFFSYSSINVLGTNIFMIAHNKNICVYKLNSDFDILDTIASYPYLSSYSRAINGKYAYSLIDYSQNSKSKQLVIIDIANKKTITNNLDSTTTYHQVYQLKNNVSCLVGTKNNELIIKAFKDGETSTKDFVIHIKEPFNIIGMTKDNELHLNYTTSGTISSYIRTKGFADIFKSLENINPFEDKDKTFIVANDNSYGSIQQSVDYSSARVLFKDSLDLSNSFVKIYTETGDEILTYNLSKDQKEQPIQTDKLYHGTYFVRLVNKGEEHNLGKFIIVR